MARDDSQETVRPPRANSTDVQPESASRRARRRTAKACRLCNAKRVKCDASERGTPCTRCEQRGEPDCTLIESRRGIYVRKPRRQQARARSHVTEANDTQIESLPSNTGDTTTVQSSTSQATASVPEVQHGRHSTTPARVQPHHETPTSTGLRQNGSSWSTVFENLLEHRDRREAVDKRSISYVGEAFPLGIILDGSRDSTGRPQLHHSGPVPISDSARSSSHPPHFNSIPPEEMAYLEAKQAFKAPADDVLDMLIAVFMDRVFPLYPIVHPQEFMEQHKTRKLPWILLHSVCFMAATFCPLRLLHRVGYDDRGQARLHFYNKTKALFDVGYETSKIVTLQVTIALTFWGGSPNTHWNFYTWISAGVTIAETIGCHRSMAGLNIHPQDRSLLKRLWWTLVVRDAACASMHGRPFRINLEHCDVDELTMDDFDLGHHSLLESPCSETLRIAGLYQIEATRLALLLRQIVTVRFYPQSQAVDPPTILHELLLRWRSALPTALQWIDGDSTHTDVFRTTLQILYHHHIILTHIKPESKTTDNPLSPSSWLGDEMASLSAQQIASLACAMVTASEELVPPHELFHGLFMACVVFFVQSRSSDPMTASLGRSALTNCKMALHVHRETWDASVWITQLFDKALSRPVVRRERQPEEPVSQPSTNINHLDVLDTSGIYLDGMEGWPNHLFLGDLFDSSFSSAAFTSTM